MHDKEHDNFVGGRVTSQVAMREFDPEYARAFNTAIGLRPEAFLIQGSRFFTHYEELVHLERFNRPDRKRAPRSTLGFKKDPRCQFLMAIVWERYHPPFPILGELFGVSRWTARRTVARVYAQMAEEEGSLLHVPEDEARKVAARTRSLDYSFLRSFLPDIIKKFTDQFGPWPSVTERAKIEASSTNDEVSPEDERERAVSSEDE